MGGVGNFFIRMKSGETIANGDYVVFLDGSSTGIAKKEALADLVGVMAGTVTSTGLSDASSVLSLDIQNMTAATTIVDADLVVVDDGANGTLRKMTRANFIESAALDAIDSDRGAIDGVTIGSASAVTALVANGGINIDDGGDGAIDGVIIGAATAAAGTFTGITATGNVSHDGGTYTFNESGVDLDFRVESDGNANMLFVNGGTNKIGIGTNAPQAGLHIGNGGSPGTASAGQDVYIKGVLEVDGSIYGTDNVAITSDMRYKRNIKFF